MKRARALPIQILSPSLTRSAAQAETGQSVIKKLFGLECSSQRRTHRAARFFVIFFLLSSPCFGQSWSNILPSSRAIDWTHAGLPATLPDGETTPNPWTPPVRSACTTAQAGFTVPISSSISVANLNTAIANCAAANANGSYLLLGPGTFTINSVLAMYSVNNITLRGSGSQQTTLSLSDADIEIGASYGAEGSGLLTSTSNYAAGSTSITIGSLSGVTPTAGLIAWLTQCDTGVGRSGGVCTGTQSDNGGIYVCGDSASGCAQQSRAGTPSHQQQAFIMKTVTNNGNGTYTIGLSSPLYMPNWTHSPNAPSLGWPNSARMSTGVGLEDLTVLGVNDSTNFLLHVQNAYGSWIKGVRFIGSGTSFTFNVANSKNCLEINNYLFPDYNITGYHAGVNVAASSDVLVLNTIVAGGIPTEYDGLNSGVVTAYNYGRDSFTLYAENGWSFDHAAFSSFDLYEANQSGPLTEDDIWGTHALNTYFRNYDSCTDPSFAVPNPRGININNYQRFENAVGNVIGSEGQCTTYQGTGYNTIFQISTGDPLVASTLMRWGNVSGVTQSSDTPPNSGVRFVSSEVPSSLASLNASLSIPVPSNSNLPCSFWLPNYTSTTCTAHPSGGTGLNWWKVCTTWTTFPTACATTQTQPFPTTGPDVSGGSSVNGYAYDIPSAVAWKSLPIDASYQHSYTISASSWSGGTEQLTVTGLPSGSVNIIGGFQLSGVNAACIPTSGVSYTSRPDSEILMTGSTVTTVSYSLPSASSNPGCTGTMKFPDVRQFDERVYMADGGSLGDPPPPTAPDPPTGVTATVE